MTRFSPFAKQCFVTLGVSLNLSQHGLVMGFMAVLLPQLKLPDAIIPLDDSSGSWIASVVGFALLGGNFLVTPIMAKYGRKTAAIASITPVLIGWFTVILAKSIPALIVARILQGIGMGMSASIGPICIGEYTSPQNRGALLTTLGLAISAGVLSVHTMGAFLHWQTTALVCGTVAFVDLIIVLFSPESPSWLADQGRYEESIKVFRFLRGDSEDDELKEMIETNKILKETPIPEEPSVSLTKRVKQKVAYLSSTIRKNEFYKPIFIMMHMYSLQQWSGANILTGYTVDVFHNVIGSEANVSLLIITLDIQRLISNTLAVFFIRKVKRRTMVFFTGGLNVTALLATAAYTFAKSKDLLPFDIPFIGVFLVHLHMFTIATGTVPLPLIIAGELFPLQYRSLAGGMSILLLSVNMFITVKTAPHLFNTVGLHGAYTLYGCMVLYCLVMAGIFLPETKDRTLQDIENEFRGHKLADKDLKAAQSLTSLKYTPKDRRFSNISIITS